jgi:CoA transferase family III
MTALSDDARAWAASGAAELTGFPDGDRCFPPDKVVAAMRRLGDAAGVDALACITERARIAGFTRNGDISCGGGTRLLEAADGWLAVSLPRADDIVLLDAWLGVAPDAGDVWAETAGALAGRAAADAAAGARLLGLPVGVLGERATGPSFTRTRLGDAPRLDRPPVVVDLSSLWAGPLCSRVLAGRGAAVMKVESATRPDGARYGPPAFFDAMNAGKEMVEIDFTAGAVRELVMAADVVIEGSRPRALEQLGVDAASIVATGPRVWLSITGHGRAAPQRDWVGFGDDAAVAGGLVAWSGGRPCFVADAVADPLTGLAAAAATDAALADGGHWLIDCNLAGVAAHVSAATARPS